MGPLVCTEVKMLRVKYTDLDEFVSDSYQKVWSFVVAEGAANDTQHRFSVDGKVSGWDRDTLTEWLDDSGPSPDTRVMLNDLAGRGMIEKGEYLVTVCW